MITEIIKQNERLIESVASKYHIQGYDIKDKVNIGRVVCWKCHKKYGRTKGQGAKFTTYLVRALKNQYTNISRDTHKRNDGPIMKDAIALDNMGVVKNVVDRDYVMEVDFETDMKRLFPSNKHRQIIVMLWQGYKMKDVQDKIKLEDKRYENRVYLWKDIQHIKKILRKYYERKAA